MKNANFILFCFVALTSLVSCGREPELDPEGQNDETQPIVSVDGKVDGYDYVDLGLRVKWATCNIGASKPTDCGSYFAWGETETRDSYSYESYKFYNPFNSHDYSQYCSPTHSDMDRFSVYDWRRELDPKDDVAKVNWGAGWRVPSGGDFNELVNNCFWEWSDDYKATGVSGWIGTSAKNGNTIFLPYAEVNARAEYWTLQDEYWCGYWASNITYQSDVAQALRLNSAEIKSREVRVSRYLGLLVRPVVETRPDVGNVCLVRFWQVTPSDTSFIGYQHVREGESANPPYDPTFLNNANYEFYEWSESFSSVTEDVDVYARFKETPKMELSVSGSANGYDYVDLGFASGVLWATYNVGASNPEQAGDLFAWGETAPKPKYDWDTYVWTDTTPAFRMTKYKCGEEPITLEAEDDAAIANWGGAWRMPTRADVKELSDGCNWRRVYNFNRSGLDGVWGESKMNGNTIFLPHNQDIDYIFAREYWFSSLFCELDGNSDGCSFDFLSEGIEPYGPTPRCVGLSVRPVISVE